MLDKLRTDRGQPSQFTFEDGIEAQKHEMNVNRLGMFCVIVGQVLILRSTISIEFLYS